MNPDLKLQERAGEALLGIEKIMRVCASEHLVNLDEDQGQACDIQWDYANEGSQGYVSFWLAKSPDDPSPSVRIELGVYDDEGRHPTAGLHVLWHVGGGIGQVQSVVLHGKRCGPMPFLRRLEGALGEAGMRAVVWAQ